MIDGRLRGVLSRFGLPRVRFRELVHDGQAPGIRKASYDDDMVADDLRESEQDLQQGNGSQLPPGQIRPTGRRRPRAARRH